MTAASVVIPAYNAQDTLPQQLDALIQELPEFSELEGPGIEILVCDNGSEDATSELVRQLAYSVPQLRLIDAAARRGPAAARNIGAESAHGQVLLFCDADDLIAPGWVPALLNAVDEADLAAGVLEGRTLNRGHRASVTWEVSSEITLPFWPRYPAGATSNLAVRAEVFRAVSGFDESLRTGEDIDFCWRVQLAGFRFTRAPDALVHSRQREGRRAVFRQAYSYAAGQRALKVKYRNFIAADSSAAMPPTSRSARSAGAAQSSPGPEPSRSFGSRLRSAVVTPHGQANLAWRLGEQLGSRLGRVPPEIRPLEPPPPAAPEM